MNEITQLPFFTDITRTDNNLFDYEHYEGMKKNLLIVMDYCGCGRRLKNGPFRTLLSNMDDQSKIKVFTLTSMCYDLSCSVTVASKEILKKKFREDVFNSTNIDQFDEAVAELALCHFFADLVSPVSLEPVTSNKPPRGDRSNTSDLLVRVPGGDTVIESTVFRCRAVGYYNKMVSFIEKEICEYFVDRKKSLDLHISIPLSFSFR